MNYDPTIYRARGNGERMESTDTLCWPVGCAEYPEGFMENAGPLQGCIVEEEDQFITLVKIGTETTGVPPAAATDTALVAPLPTDPAARKAIPIATGFLDYFPDAVAAVAELSQIGNDQHNPGKPLHWDRSKSGDEADALSRHLVQRGTWDHSGSRPVRHTTKVAWRAMAMLQKEIEASRGGGA